MNRFITLEGIEGVGKTTALAHIEALFVNTNTPYLLTREPGGTPLAESIRKLLLSPETGNMSPESELLLLFAARAAHIRDVIQPALEQQHWVICDRFTDTSYAYQGAGRGIATDHIAYLENWIQADLRPGLTLVLDAPPKLALSRAKNRSAADRFEQESLEFFTRARAAYLARAEELPQRYQVIDASQPLTIIQAELTEIITAYLRSQTA